MTFYFYFSLSREKERAGAFEGRWQQECEF